MIYGLIGRTLKHSMSVPIHRALGNGLYRLYELEPDEIGAFVRDERLGGINVTIPYKRDVLKFCDVISPEAAVIGSANTVVRRGGELYAYNTDFFGFSYMLDRAGIDVSKKKVLILGSGGTSLTAKAVCAARNAAETITVSRSGKDNYENLTKHRDASIIINTTPVGMYPAAGVSPLDIGVFPQLEGVVDVIYNPLTTKLLYDAETAGIKHTGGLPMLVAQGVAADGIFFDREAGYDRVEPILASLYEDMRNTVLIGMPGCGKSTVGKLIAQKTGKRSVDTDDEICAETGRDPAEILKTDGEAVFRAIEADAVKISGAATGAVIACGGEVVTREENYYPLHSNGVICFIDAPPEELITDGRPLSLSRGVNELYRERLPAYRRFADVTVKRRQTPRETAEAIMEALKDVR